MTAGERFEKIKRKNPKQKGNKQNYLSWIECRGRGIYQLTI